MKKKRTYFFELFGKWHHGVCGVDIPVWDNYGDKRTVILKQLKRVSPTMENLWYTLDGSTWQLLEWGKRTPNGIERKDFYYIK